MWEHRLSNAVVAGSALLASFLLTAAIREYALRHSILDIPNARSLHSEPTPRGGGIAILAVVTAGLLGLWIAGAPRDVIVAMLGGVPIGLIGWLDDRRPIPAPVRILVHFACAGWALTWLGGLPVLQVSTGTVQLHFFGTVIALVGIVWCVNLYNFMDGIDGLAATEAVVIGAFGSALLIHAGRGSLGAIALLLCASAAGFLLWNWPPAKIFMGDAGSGFLGFSFAILALASEHAHAVPLLVWALLAGVFITDATITVIRRMSRGERWYHAHRSHAYQRLVRSGWTHARTTVAATSVSAALGALAWVASSDAAHMAMYVLIGGMLLVMLYLVVEHRAPMRREAPARPEQAAR